MVVTFPDGTVGYVNAPYVPVMEAVQKLTVKRESQRLEDIYSKLAGKRLVYKAVAGLLLYSGTLITLVVKFG